MFTGTIVVKAVWDPDATVWVATSDDVPGLVAEAATQQDLLAKLNELVPELLELNAGLSDLHQSEADCPSELPMIVTSSHVTKVRTRMHG